LEMAFLPVRFGSQTGSSSSKRMGILVSRMQRCHRGWHDTGCPAKTTTTDTERGSGTPVMHPDN